MIDPDKKQMMEDSSYIVWPMKKQLEKYFCHDVTRNFDSKLHRKSCKIIIEHDQHFAYWKSRITFENVLNTLQQQLEIEGSW